MLVDCLCYVAFPHGAMGRSEMYECGIPGRAHLPYYTFLHRGSYISAHDLLNLLNELEKEIKCDACRAFHLLTSLMNSIIQKHEC